VRSARNRELLALIPATLLVIAGFAAVFLSQDATLSTAARSQGTLSDLSLTIGAVFLGLCLAVHLVMRFTLPDADPYLFPLVAVLACFGLVIVYRIDADLAREQAQWFVVGLLVFVATIVFLRDFRKLEQYRYTIAAGALLLLLLPRVPGIGKQSNGAYLGVGIGPITFQPAEFAKIAIVVFLAAYLKDTRQVLVLAARRILGVTFPPLKHFGPVLVIWGTSMFMLVFIRDLGSSLMFYGAFLALLYVATSRLSFVVIGFGLFALGAWFIASPAGRVLPGTGQVGDRVDIWLHTFDPTIYGRSVGSSYQLAQGLFAQADGGLFGAGFGQALIVQPGSGTPILPAPETDLIYAVVTNELGLAGACGLILVYLLFAERGFKTAMLARDSFSKLLAAGLSSVFALQVFVIVGGVTRVIPLTGVTLPFVSYGGSSIVANFMLLALLLMVSDRARREAAEA
jgi:cell division protein FtsW (lipid II flippase)